MNKPPQSAPAKNSNLLASLAVFSELYNNKQDVSGIIANFIEHLIVSENKYSFGLTEITHQLNSTYGFDLPESVVKPSIKRTDLNISLTDGRYQIHKKDQRLGSNPQAEIEEKQNENEDLIASLIEYIATHRKCQATEIKRDKVIESLRSSILDDGGADEYSNIISAFIIENGKDHEFTRKFKQMKEGLIIYTGIQYTDIGKLGSWKSELTIIVDTEILFNFAGYNGTVYRKLWDDFYGLVREINEKNRGAIKIIYCSEVKQTMEKFFYFAEDVVSGNTKSHILKPAMASIIEGCSTGADVIQKKNKFLTDLARIKIKEDDKNDYYEETNHRYNINHQSLAAQFATDISEENDRLEILNKTNIRNKGKCASLLDSVNCIFITGTRTILDISRNLARETKAVPLAVSLDFMTNKFWFILNKGFGGESIATFDVITKAQIVLSWRLNDSVSKAYDKLKEEYGEGNLDEDTATQTIAELRQRILRPEQISKENIEGTLEGIEKGNIEFYAKQSQGHQIDKKNAVSTSIDLCGKLLCEYDSKFGEMRKKGKLVNDEIKKKRKCLKWGLVSILIALILLVFCIYCVDKVAFIYLSIQVPVTLVIIAFIYVIVTEKDFKKIHLYKWIQNLVINRTRIEKKHGFNSSELNKLKQNVEEQEKQLEDLKGGSRN